MRYAWRTRSVPSRDRTVTDRISHSTSRIARDCLSMCRPSSVPKDGGEPGRSLRAGSAPPSGRSGREGEWDGHRGPQLRDCARMVHKTANVLDKMPKDVQAKAKGMLHDIYLAETKAAAGKAFDLFVKTYEAKYPKATDCLAKDRDVLLAFYDFPAEHW